MSSLVGFDAAGLFIDDPDDALLTTAAGGGVRVDAAVVAVGKATAGENEMNLGKLPPDRAVTRTIAPAVAAAVVVVAGAVTRSKPEVDIDSGDDGGVNV